MRKTFAYAKNILRHVKRIGCTSATLRSIMVVGFKLFDI